MQFNVESLKKEKKYWLEYDYYIHSHGKIDLVYIKDIHCLLNIQERYCMILNFERRKIKCFLNEVNAKYAGGSQILFNCNVGIEEDYNEEIMYLKSSECGIKSISVHDSYIADIEVVDNCNSTTLDSIVELTPDNIIRYNFNECGEIIKHRPSLEKLIDIFVAKGHGHIMAYISNNSIIGYLSYTDMLEDTYDVDYIYVTKNHRKNGIGTALGNCYIQKSKTENKNAFWSNVNTFSVKVAKRLGCRLCCRHISFTNNIDS